VLGRGKLFTVSSDPLTAVVYGPCHALPMHDELCVTLLYFFTCYRVPVAKHVKTYQMLSNRSKRLFLILLFHPAAETAE